MIKGVLDEMLIDQNQIILYVDIRYSIIFYFEMFYFLELLFIEYFSFILYVILLI